MLRTRLIAAAAIILPVLAIFWLDVNANFGFPGIWLLLLTVILGLLITAELRGLLREHTPGVAGWVVFSGTTLTIVSVAIPEAFSLPPDCPVGRWGWSSLALGTTLALAFLAEMWSFDKDRQSSIRISLAVLVVMYSGWLLSFLMATRLFLENQWGAVAVFSAVLIIKMSDTGAYFAGKQFGRTKLVPRLSPGKTVEGFVGGLVAALFAGWLMFDQILPIAIPDAPRIPWWASGGYAVSLAVLGVFGDLCESLLKRDMERKDSSGWLPGLGGVMDVFDSVLLAAPVTFMWWTTGWLGGL